MDDAVRQEIARLQRMRIPALRERYYELFGEPTNSSNHAHLFRRIAWRLQARAQGDLSERARERALQLADYADLRLRAPRQFWIDLAQQSEPTQPAVDAERDPRLPPLGAIVHREYRGKQIAVTVQADGFAYAGRTYTSLSAVARQVTGTRWNGFVFFGLQDKDAR